MISGLTISHMMIGTGFYFVENNSPSVTTLGDSINRSSECFAYRYALTVYSFEFAQS